MASSDNKLNYAYFSQGPTPAAAPPPRKLTEEEAAQAAELERQRKEEGGGASAWNHAGTFEERDFSSWAQGQAKELIKGKSFSSGGTEVVLTDVAEAKGHANAWIVRGKKRHGFDLELTINWTATVGGTEVRGSAKVPNAASDELDEIQIQSVEPLHKTAGREAAEAAAVKAVQSKLPEILEKALNALLEDLKKK